MSHALLTFLLANKTPEMVALGWLFSCAMSTMPPLREGTGYMLTWAHNFLQTVAGNINKINSK